MIRLKTLLEQASKESIRVAGKPITGKHIANTENAADKWMYFKGDNNRYYAALKSKQVWRDLKSTLSPSNYNIASTRIESWIKVNPTTPTAETPAEPNAAWPSAEPSKYTTRYTMTWKQWKLKGYDIAPGSMPPDDNVKLFHTRGHMMVSLTLADSEKDMAKVFTEN